MKNDLIDNRRNGSIKIENRKIRSLTGIRGFAAVWVVCFHTFRILGGPLGAPVNVPFLDRGYLAVDLFFVLSGFVLVMSTEKLFLRNWAQATKSFFVGRLTRVWPLNVIVLLLIGALCLFDGRLCMGPAKETLLSFLASLMLVQTWWPGHSMDWNFPAWSLSAEWFAYATFPVFILFIANIKSFRFAFAMSIVFIIIFMAIIFAAHIILGHSINIDATQKLAIPRCLLEFYAGALVYRAIFLRKGAANIFTTVISILGVFIVSTVKFADVVAPLVFFGLIVSAFYEDVIIKKIFGNNVAVFLGEVSFSMYLIHVPILVIYEKIMPTVSRNNFIWLLTLFPIILLSVSFFSFKYIEKPFYIWGKLYQKTLRERGASSCVKDHNDLLKQ